MIRKIFFFVLFSLLIFNCNIFSQKVGSTAMQFLKVMPSARATAIGDAYTVLASGADAVFWNPGGIAKIEKLEFSTTYINWIFDTKQGAFSFATPIMDFGAVGLQIQYVDFGEFIETSNLDPYIKNLDGPGITGRTFRPFSYLIGLSYSKFLTDRFSTGIGIKYVHESLYNGQEVIALVRTGGYEKVKTWANGLIFDFGMYYNTGFHSVQIATAVQNFGANVKYAKESNPVPLLFRFGIAANVIGSDALILTEKNNRLSIEFDLFQPNDYAQQAHLGIEYEFSGIFAIRTGYKINYDCEGITLGAGLKHNIAGLNLMIDYSYGSIGKYLGSVHRFSLGAQLQ